MSEISGLLLWRVEPVGGSGLDGSLNFSRSQEVAPPGPQAPRPSVKVIEQHTIFSNFLTMRPPLTSLFVLLGPQSFYIIIFVGWVWIQVKVKAQEKTFFVCLLYNIVCLENLICPVPSKIWKIANGQINTQFCSIFFVLMVFWSWQFHSRVPQLTCIWMSRSKRVGEADYNFIEERTYLFAQVKCNSIKFIESLIRIQLTCHSLPHHQYLSFMITFDDMILHKMDEKVFHGHEWWCSRDKRSHFGDAQFLLQKEAQVFSKKVDVLILEHTTWVLGRLI